MCIATAALITSIVGTGVGAAGAIEGGNARSSAANYQAQVARNNAIAAGQQADYALKAGDIQAAAQGTKGAARVGEIKTKQAANNIDVNSGSALDVRAGESEITELNQLQTKQNALLQAYGYQSEERSDTAQAGLDETEASNAKTSGYLQAGAGLLGSASSLGFKWQGLQNPDAGSSNAGI